MPAGTSVVFRQNKILGYAQRKKGGALEFEFLFPDSDKLSRARAYLVARMKSHNANPDSMQLRNEQRDRGVLLRVNVREGERSAEYLNTVCHWLGIAVPRLTETSK